MIDRARGLWRLLPAFSIWIWLVVWGAAGALYCLAVVFLFRHFDFRQLGGGTQATVIDGAMLGLLLAFRVNAAYARWWEARQLWGQLVNESRNLALKVRAYVAPAAD